MDELLGAYRANGLAVVGIEATRKALEMGQVDELVIAAPPPDERAGDELVAKARQTAARIRFVAGSRRALGRRRRRRVAAVQGVDMSKHINVNPDHYKVAGRERPGNAVVKDRREPASGSEKTRQRWEKRQEAAKKKRG